jgi:carboxylesterase type B
MQETRQAKAGHFIPIVSPLTFKKRWTKSSVIRLFNESENARRIGLAYPETSLSGKSVSRIITDVAAPAAQWDAEQAASANTGSWCSLSH